MDFGSIRRKNKVLQPSRKKTYSTSNLSCISFNSAAVGRKTLYVTLPKNFGCEVNLEGRIVHLSHGGPAHAVGILQIGDYLRIVEDSNNDRLERERDSISSLVKLQVTYGVLQVDTRPECPLVIEIGNRSNTSLGIALADCPENKIRINSIQPGSLADRCGFLKPGDTLRSINLGSSNESLPCSPYYNSYQIAQILRQLTSKNPSISLTIVPGCDEKDLFGCSNEDLHSGGSSSTLTLADSQTYQSQSTFFNSMYENSGVSNSNSSCNGSGSRRSDSNNGSRVDPVTGRIDEVDEEVDEEGNPCVLLSFCLWKDMTYDDWGFSLVDHNDTTDLESECEDNCGGNGRGMNGRKIELGKRQGAIVYQIRPGGPAFVAGLLPRDRILQINGRDVSHLESTMLVPILASLEDALNVVISRISSVTESGAD